ncbi:hypothetical protein Tco_0048133, partial [Tanacetum coccineum]
MSKFGAIKHTEVYSVPFHTQKVFTTLRVNAQSFSGRTVQLFESMLVPQGEGSENPTEPHHTPSAQYESTHQADQTTSPEPIQPDTTIPSQSHSDISTPKRFRGTIRISQSKVLSPGADETASPTRDDIHGEAFPTASSLNTGQDRENIAKTSAMPHESSPRVTSLDGGEGRGCSKHWGIDQREDLIVVNAEINNEKSNEKGSDSTDEMANVLSTLGAVNGLSSGGTASTLASGSFPTAAIFTTASVTTPYTRKTRASKG